jgi:hypothetical protein
MNAGGEPRCRRSPCRDVRTTCGDLAFRVPKNFVLHVPFGCPLSGVKGHSLTLPARRDEWIALRCVAFHEGVCLRRFATIEAFLKTFKCRRAAFKRHPQRGTLGVHLKVICRSKP